MSANRLRQRRDFQPRLEAETLEPRMLLSHTHPRILIYGQPQALHVKNLAAHLHKPLPRFLAADAPPVNGLGNYQTQRAVGLQVARGGKILQVTAPDGNHFNIQVIGAGIIRGVPMSGGRVGITLDGSTDTTEVDVNPLPFPQKSGYAHSLAIGVAGQPQLLNIGSINVSSGRIFQFNGYHTADLSGPMTIGGNSVVDRISFDSILPGGSIGVQGDLNTLDVLHAATFSGTPGLFVGRDLNFLNIGGTLTLENGANLHVGRDIGLTPQYMKGTEVGIPANPAVVPPNPQPIGSSNLSTTQNFVSAAATLLSGALIQGNFQIAPGSQMIVGDKIIVQPGANILQSGTSPYPGLFLVRGGLYANPTNFNVTGGINDANTGTNFFVIGPVAPYPAPPSAPF